MQVYAEYNNTSKACEMSHAKLYIGLLLEAIRVLD